MTKTQHRTHTAPTWEDPERVAKLKQLHAEGHSASIIARVLGGFDHCSDGGRSAILGKVHRLGLPSRATAFRSSRPPRKRKLTREHLNKSQSPAVHPWRFGPPKPPRQDGLPLPVPGEADVPRVATVDLEERHCRWPCREDVRGLGQSEPIFCGSDKLPMLPYCEVHARKAYQPPQPRQRFVPRVVEKETVAA